MSTTRDGTVFYRHDVVFVPGAWIKQPDGYGAFGATLVNGSVGEGRDSRMHWYGDIGMGSCGRLELTEVS